MNTRIAHSWKAALSSRLLVPVVAAAMIVSAAAYHFANPARAAAAAPAPAAAALDDNSVGALLSLDHAMETLAARVTPAIVNVTVTSKSKPDTAEQQLPDDMQQFFGP